MVGKLPCGCQRDVLVLCDTGVELARALREEFSHSIQSGDWGGFDKLQDELEAHLRAKNQARRKSCYG